MSVQAPPVAGDEAIGRREGITLPWLLTCLWAAWWTWHVVWWLVPGDVQSDDPDALFALVVWSGSLLLLVATLIEVALGKRPGGFGFWATSLHALVFCGAGVALLFLPYPINILGMGLVFSALIDVPVLLLLGWDRGQYDDASPDRIRLLCLFGAIFGTVFVLLSWSWANVGIVGWRAHSAAGGKPYCLQVNDEAGYRVVNSWSDLAGLRMTTPMRSAGITSGDTWQWAFHAVLVVNDEGRYWAYNWSHAVQSFVPLPDGPQVIGYYRFRRDVVIYCTPVADFLATMGQHEPAPPPRRRFPDLPDSAYGRANPDNPVPRPFAPAASWQEGLWSRLLTRYLSMQALIELCEIEVDPAVLEAIDRSAGQAAQKLAMSDAAIEQYSSRIDAMTRSNAADYCNPESQYRRDLTSSFPRPPAVR